MEDFDYTYVNVPARIAVYDDMLSSPRIEDIEPAPTRDYINNLASSVYQYAHEAGGKIPFSIILQAAENFIHAQFREIVVSIFDDGNTIRFSDQGPGIHDKDRAQQPGFSSANSEMKKIIHGVGSGLPIVREYMETKNGHILIEDNLDSGAVVTISLNKETPVQAPIGNQAAQIIANATASTVQSQPIAVQEHTSPSPEDLALASLSKRGANILTLFLSEEVLGVSGISKELGIPNSSVHSELKKHEEAGMITKLGTKRVLTDLGAHIASRIT